MARIQTQPRLFGLDLSSLWGDLSHAFQAMGSWAFFRWLQPVAAVRCHLPNGQVLLCKGQMPVKNASPGAIGAASFVALELPEDLLLRRDVALPPGLAVDEAASALGLAVESASPFPLSDLLWVALPAASAQVMRTVVLTSRALVQQHLDQFSKTLAGPLASSPTEVWVPVPGLPSVVLPGFGEAARTKHQRAWLGINWGLVVLALLLAGGLAVTPTLQLRARALDAVQQHTSLQQQVAPLLLQREAMVKSVDLLASLQALAGQPVSTLRVIDLVTRAMPDDASLLTFQLLASDPAAKGPKVIMTGQATNAAALMQQLSNQPGIREVKAPSAAVKPLGAIKESFSIEFVVDFAALPATAAATGQP